MPASKVLLGRKTLEIGSLSIGVSIDNREIAEDVGALYADYPQLDGGGLADFVVELTAPNWWRRALRPQVQFFLDGTPPFVPLPVRLGTTMFESAINWCIFLRVLRYLILHAAVVERGGRALVLPGYSGSGKSTLCAELVRSGWRLLSDEFCMIDPADGLVYPHPRPISLKNDAIDMMMERSPGAFFSRRFEGTLKGTLCYMKAPGEAVARAREAAKPFAVVAPRFKAQAQQELRRLPKAEAFMEWIGHSCNYYGLNALGFETMARLVEHCEHYSLTYSDLDKAVGVIDDLFQVGEEV